MAPLCCTSKFDAFLSLDCPTPPPTRRNARKGSNFAIWQPCQRVNECELELPIEMHVVRLMRIREELISPARSIGKMLDFQGPSSRSSLARSGNEPTATAWRRAGRRSHAHPFLVRPSVSACPSARLRRRSPLKAAQSTESASGSRLQKKREVEMMSRRG